MMCNVHASILTLWRFFFVLLCFFCLSKTANSKTLDINTYINNGTCDVSSDQNVVVFTPVSPNAFNKRKQTVQLMNFKLAMTNCFTLSGGVMRPGIRVNGDVSQEDPYLFQKITTDSAAGVGMILREGEYSGALMNFYDQSAMVTDGEYTHLGQLGESAVNKELSFTVGLSNGDSQSSVTPGDVLAYLEFSFGYH